MVIDFANKIVNHIHITPQEVKKLLSMSFGSGWIKLHPNYLETIPKAEDLFAGIPPNTQMQQIEAVHKLDGNQLDRRCWELTKISNPTLVITGTNDILYQQPIFNYCRKNPWSLACTDQRCWYSISRAISR